MFIHPRKKDLWSGDQFDEVSPHGCYCIRSETDAKPANTNPAASILKTLHRSYRPKGFRQFRQISLKQLFFKKATTLLIDKLL
jgi:hypothetical protein